MYVNYGHIQTPSNTILPKSKSFMIGHKASNTATGCSGVLTLKIDNTGYFAIGKKILPLIAPTS